MDNQRSPRKKFFKRLLSQSHSDNDTSGRRGSAGTNASQPSLHQDASHSEPSKSKSFRNIFKSRHSHSASQSSHPRITPASSPQDRSSDGQNQSSTSLASNVNPSQDINPGAAETELLNPRNKIEDANKAITDIRDFSGAPRNITSVSNNLQPVLHAVDTVSPIIASLKVFNSIANTIADIHPYAKAVLSIFTCASQMILNQQDRDNALRDLLKKLSDVYTFMTDDKRLIEIAPMKDLYERLARQTLECADFIVHYAETKSEWKRLAKDVFRETDSAIQSYNNVLDTLMQQFRDGADRDMVVNVHHFVEGMDFKDMEYAKGAGRVTAKCCLPGTREDILSEIKNWIDYSGEDVQRIFWLNGTAGKGKSAIAHTIADWFNARGSPGAFFCFDRTREADELHKKIITTVARDLADGDPIIRRALANVIRNNNELRHTADVMRQWKELILGPVGAVGETVTAPVLIIIDALDESGNADSREEILRVLSGKQGTTSRNKVNFPQNIRVLVTSRPLDDIHKYLDNASHVHHVSMDDTLHVSRESSERDVQQYISNLLQDLEDFDEGDFNKLAVKSDGLFEWARLVCEYILGTNVMGQRPRQRFEGVLAGKSEKGTRLLDNIYQRILEDIMPKDDYQEAMRIFRSVMGQILASLEPLPCAVLTAMRRQFLPASERYKVEQVIRPLGSLITGTSDSHIPIRPLHASFYDFLTDESRSKAFYVDVALAQRNLSFASLGVMKDQLRFNICSLESSYLPNSVIPNLEERVKASVSTELSYSCRFWGTHVSATSVERSLVEEVKAFFDDERLLFWLEVVSLLKVVGGSVATLSCIVDWLKGHSESTDTADTVKDTRRFVRTCAPAILRSTPHLCLSALPFVPTQSAIFNKFIARFPRTPSVVAGHVAHWPSMEKTISVPSFANTIAILPDGRRIVCGSDDGTICIRDMETGEELSALIGHSGQIWSIAVSPNGHRIVSGSADGTIWIWDADTGEPLGGPLLGHDGEVNSVSISPNGNRIVSGSEDMTIRVWDLDTGNALGVPLIGHTDAVTSIAIFPDGIRIVSGSYDNTIKIWDIVTGNALGAPLLGHTDWVRCVAISHSRNIIVSCSDDLTIRMWDATTGDALGVLRGHNDRINSIVISPDGNYIVSGSLDTTIRLWDVETRKELGMPLQRHTGSVLCVAVSPDGRRLVSSSLDHTIRLWEADTRNAFTAPLERGSGGGILSVAISQDGARIVTGSNDNMVRVWDAYTGKPLLASLQGHTDWVWCVAISPIGNLIVSGSSYDTIRMWDLMTGEALRTPLQGHTDIIFTLAISSDGTRIVSGSADKTIRMWDAITGDALGTPLHGHTDDVLSVAISLDGNLIISGSWDKTIRVWNTKTGEALGAPLQGHTGGVFSVAISRDGRRIVSSSADKTLHLWDVATRKTSGDPLKGHTDWVRSVAISLDGNFVVSCSDDNTIRVWDTLSGEALGAPLRGHTSRVRSISVSPDSKRIVSCSDDATIRTWDLEFFAQKHQSFKLSSICFSSDPFHALSSSSSFFRGDLDTPAPLVPNEDGWIVGPDGRLLLWVPASLYPVVYVPNILGTLRDVLEVDLSQFAHGESWQICHGDDLASS